MALSPQPGPGPHPREPAPPLPRRPPLLPLLAAALLLAGLGGGLVGWADRALRLGYDQARAALEAQLGRLLGHPLQLGAYRGLGWGGLELGPSRLLPGRQDGSSAAVAGINVSLDPLASLQRWRPVLRVGLRDGRIELRRNRRGQYWVPGAPRAGRPVRLDLQLRLLGPARVRIEPQGFEARLSAGLTLHTAEQRWRLQGRLSPRAGGSLGLRLESGSTPGRWQLELRPQRLPLAALRQLAQLPGHLGGEASGALQLGFGAAGSSCRGRLQVPHLELGGDPRSTLQAQRVSLRCRGAALALSAPRWRAGGWRGEGRLGYDAASGRLTLRLSGSPVAATPSPPLRLEAAGRWRRGQLDDLALRARRGASRLQLSGAIGRTWALTSRFTLHPGDLPLRSAPPAWLRRTPIRGRLDLGGPLAQPALEGSLAQAANPLLGDWRASWGWRAGSLRLASFRSAHLDAEGTLPLRFEAGRGARSGTLALRLSLRRLSLSRLSPLVGTPLAGALEGSGTVRGPLGALVPDLALTLDRARVGPLGLQERWQGTWQGAADGGGALRMEPRATAVPGLLTARLDRRWVPVQVALQRGGGSLSLQGSPRAYRWQARGLPLTGLVLAVGPKARLQPLQGALSGSGQLNLQPLAFGGQVEIGEPVFLGVRGQRLQLQGRYADRRYSASGRFDPVGSGDLQLRWTGAWRGPFRSRLEGRGLAADTFQQLSDAWPQWRDGPPAIGGRAADLGELVIDTLGGSITQQLAALDSARERLASFRRTGPGNTPAERLESLRARVDLNLDLWGPSLEAVSADLQLRSHLWLEGADRDAALGERPLLARLQGPLRFGAGRFSFEQLPLSLLALLTSVPPGVSGSLSGSGRYRIGGGTAPALALDLDVDGAALRGTPLQLERGLVALVGRSLRLDLALRAAGASSSVELAGVVPLDPSEPELELRLASRGDGVRFLSGLAEPALQWQQGSADLQLLVRGSLRQPIANGFVRVRDGQLRFIDQSVRDVQALVLFDFQQLVLQQFNASLGARGRIRGSGSLALWDPAPTGAATVGVELREVPIKLPRLAVVADGQLQLGGSLRQPVMGGDVRLARGSVNLRPGGLATEAGGVTRPVSLPQLVESRWDFRQPLLLLGPEQATPTAGGLDGAVPRFSPLAFNNLRLRLGPELRVGVPNVATFSTGGQLRLNGRLDPSLSATGVVRLQGGRLNLFTTTFSLDPDAPNVAVFTPALGLVPYLDIALRTRVSDSLASPAIGTGGLGGPNAQDLVSSLPQASFSSLSQLNLVRITVSVSGPADRIGERIRLRSSPPLTQERLIALIGGNSLAGLSGAGAGAALATVLGQSLLSPVLGGLSEAFGQRLSFALYPTYVTPTLNDGNDMRSRQVPPQLVLGSELGLDITDRFNASVLTAPNRSDIPPQLTLTYKASDTINLQSSFDTEGAWQGQLQLFFRF